MKKIRIYIVSLFFCLFLTDCDKQLDLVPLGELSNETFYQTDEQYQFATLSAYNTLLNFGWNAYEGYGKMSGFLMPDDDMIPSNNSGNSQEEFNWTAGNNQFAYLFGELYKGVGRANQIIYTLPNAKGFADPSQKARHEAEARFLRGYFYFLLAINWGNPPVIETNIETYEQSIVGNSEPGKIWEVMIEDLTFATQNLPPSWNKENLGRATSGAAKGLLGKVYLFRAQILGNTADYANAITQLQDVVNSGTYQLVNNYGDNFSANKENNAESLFEIQYSGGDNNNQWLPNDFGTPENQNVGSTMSGRLAWYRPACSPTGVCAPAAGDAAQGRAETSPSLRAAIEPNDPRRRHIFFLDGDPYDIQKDDKDVTYSANWSLTGSTPSKYLIEGGRAGFPSISDVNNDRILRYADVLLMLAEARLLGNNDVAGAAELINMVRRRADPTQEILQPRPASASVVQMFEWLMLERRIELAYEGWRYFDLVRWHKAGRINIKDDIDFGTAIANANWNEKHLLKPYPSAELGILPIKQNPGY